jgi:hypothetical protein
MATNNTFFTVKKLLQLVEVMREPSSLFLDLFFKEVEKFETEIVEIDVYKEKRHLAQFTHSDSESHVHRRTEFERTPYRAPYIKEKLPTTATEMLYATRGEHIYSSQTPVQRATTRMTRDMQELMRLAIRRKEWLAGKLLDGGAVQIVGKGLNYLLDFDMPASNQVVLGPGDRWSDAGVSIAKDLREFRRIIGQESGKVPNIAVLGSDVIDVILADEEIDKALDNRRKEIGHIHIKDLPLGARYIGNFEGMELYGYDEQFIEVIGGNPQNYMPRNKIFMGHSEARTVKAYGVIKDKRALYATEYFFKTWEQEDPSVDWLQMQSAPMPGLSESCAFGVFEVLEG